jgi:hypothetical protein
VLGVAGDAVSFKDASWDRRFAEMGDQAEGVFEAVCKRGFVRCGLNRPPLRMSDLPTRVRYWPDYLCSNKFVEVQGCGRDQKFKLKLSKWGALRWWNDLHPVELFLWDSFHKRYCYVTLDQLEALIGTSAIGTFPEGHVYFEFAADAVFEVAETVGEYTRAA